MHPVYLDYNATSPLRPAAAAAVAEALSRTGNASSVHRFGRGVRAAVESAREAVAALAGVGPAQVVFTSGGTEANNLALACAMGGWAKGNRVLVSAGEHDSVLRAAPRAEKIPLAADGTIDLRALRTLLSEATPPALISIMLANNETGVIQPVAEAARLARAAGALVHCDAVQAAGKIPVDFAALGVDLLSLSAHKLGGPQGVGALVTGAGVALAPLLRGGGQERGQRAGTENAPGIAGFGAAAREVEERLHDAARLAVLRDRLESGVRGLVPGVRLFGAGAPRLPNTAFFAVPGLRAETQVMALDLAGVAVGSGSACSSGKVRPSHVLRAMGVDEETSDCAIRVSLGWASEAADVDAFVEAWGTLLRRTGDRTSALQRSA